MGTRDQSWLCPNCAAGNMDWDYKCRVCGYNRDTIGTHLAYRQPVRGRRIA